jgi:hypothetical protein
MLLLTKYFAAPVRPLKAAGLNNASKRPTGLLNVWAKGQTE